MSDFYIKLSLKSPFKDQIKTLSSLTEESLFDIERLLIKSYLNNKTVFSELFKPYLIKYSSWLRVFFYEMPSSVDRTMIKFYFNEQRRYETVLKTVKISNSSWLFYLVSFIQSKIKKISEKVRAKLVYKISIFFIFFTFWLFIFLLDKFFGLILFLYNFINIILKFFFFEFEIH